MVTATTSTTYTEIQTKVTFHDTTTSRKTTEITAAETTTALNVSDAGPNVIAISVGVTLAALIVIITVVLFVLARRGKLCQRRPSGRKSATSTLQHPNVIDQYNRNSDQEGGTAAGVTNPYHPSPDRNAGSARVGTPNVSEPHREHGVSRSGTSARPEGDARQHSQSKSSTSDQFTPGDSAHRRDRDECCADEQPTRNPKRNTYQNISDIIKQGKEANDPTDIYANSDFSCESRIEDTQSRSRQSAVDGGQDPHVSYVNWGVSRADLVDEVSSTHDVETAATDEHIYSNYDPGQSNEDDDDRIYGNMHASTGDQPEYNRAISEELYINHETARCALNEPNPSEVRTENTPLSDTKILRRSRRLKTKEVISQLPPDIDE